MKIVAVQKCEIHLLVSSSLTSHGRFRKMNCTRNASTTSFRSSSEERVLDSPTDVADTIRRVSSHEDFNSQEHLHILSQLGQDMGHGVVSIIATICKTQLSKNMTFIIIRALFYLKILTNQKSNRIIHYIFYFI